VSGWWADRGGCREAAGWESVHQEPVPQAPGWPAAGQRGLEPQPPRRRALGRRSGRCGDGLPLGGDRRAAHLPLALVVERQAKGIPEGHQGALHGVGFGLLDGRFVGQAQVGVDAVAGAGALADQGAIDAGMDGDAHAGDVGDPPAGLVVPARASGTDGAFGLGSAAREQRLALPAIEAKDAVGLGDQEVAAWLRRGAPLTPPALASPPPVVQAPKTRAATRRWP
jgi:hypothetical protein